MIGVHCTIIKLAAYDLLVVSPTILIKYPITRPPPGPHGGEDCHCPVSWVLCVAGLEVLGFWCNSSRMQADRAEAVGCQPVAVGCQPVAVGCQPVAVGCLPQRYIARRTLYTSASERTSCKVPDGYHGDFRQT